MLSSHFHFTYNDFSSGANRLDFLSAPPLPAPHSMTSDAPIKPARAVPGHAGWILSDTVDGSVRTRVTAEKKGYLATNTG